MNTLPNQSVERTEGSRLAQTKVERQGRLALAADLTFGIGAPVMKRIIFIALASLACPVLIALIGMGLLVWQFERPPFALSRLERLRPSMTTNEVRQILGTPTSAWLRTDEAGQLCSEWAYSRSMSWPIVYVYFKPDGTFQSHRYDR